MKTLLLAILFVSSMAQAQTYVVCKTAGGTEIVVSGSSCPSGTYFIRYG